jgi:hypothetical protein
LRAIEFPFSKKCQRQLALKKNHQFPIAKSIGVSSQLIELPTKCSSLISVLDDLSVGDLKIFRSQQFNLGDHS